MARTIIPGRQKGEMWAHCQLCGWVGLITADDLEMPTGVGPSFAERHAHTRCDTDWCPNGKKCKEKGVGVGTGIPILLASIPEDVRKK